MPKFIISAIPSTNIFQKPKNPNSKAPKQSKITTKTNKFSQNPNIHKNQHIYTNRYNIDISIWIIAQNRKK